MNRMEPWEQRMNRAAWRRGRRIVAAARRRPLAYIFPQRTLIFSWSVPEVFGKLVFKRVMKLIAKADAPTLVAAYATALSWELNARGTAHKVFVAAKYLNADRYDEALAHMEGMQWLAEMLHSMKGPIDADLVSRLAGRLGSSGAFAVVWRALDQQSPDARPSLTFSKACRIEAAAKQEGVWDLIPAIVQQTPAEPSEWLSVARAIAV